VARAHQHLLDHLGTVVFELGADGRLIFINHAWERLTGYPAAEAQGRPLAELFHPDEREAFREAVGALRGTDGHCEMELRLVTRDGGVVWCALTLDAMAGVDHGTGISGQLMDVTERKQAQQRLEYLALHDPLTGLHNRNHFNASLAHLSATAARGAGNHALLYLDIDHFKVVNDTLGHKKGDILLKELAGVVLVRIRDADIFCRLSGDEFTLLLANTPLEQARKVAEELRATVQGYRFTYNQRDFELTASIGLAEIDGRHASPEEYFIEADKALFVAKSRGRNMVHVFDPDDRETDDLSSSIDWVRRLREAIAAGRIDLHLQPILHVASGRVEHYEALVRLSLEDGSTVPPGVFIPALERAGEIAALDHWVITRAISMLAEHPALGRMAVNLSAHAFRDERILPLVEEELAVRRVAPQRLIFEITETASLANMNLAERMIQRLRALGCGFALDDFGTGFSTFAYLKQLPADFLKVDGSFIRNIHRDEADRALVRSINEVAHALGKQTVAEFVEEQECLEVLRELGVDYAQGYGIGRPQPLSELPGLS
ncbi:putative bifunctional diguanylate cyclase/phosphodiesterase, partial [Endothiovibrio diazotrophicus]